MAKQAGSVFSFEQREDRAKELMEEFHIEHLRDSLGQALSGGERRRVEIARAQIGHNGGPALTFDAVEG
ncbi:ATP-binding cassette domain-containing protein, partial [Klebsiella pneumoniae]|nr:ATP-binding cassette domain-containing protein [Klebsiella pneumoniae]